MTAQYASNGNAPIYLDWNATTPVHPAVQQQMLDAQTQLFGNPSSVHWFGRAAREGIESARASLAKAFAAHQRDVLFVSGGTEANNLALLDAKGLITSELEHPSVTRVAHELERRGKPVRWLPAMPTGLIDVDALAQAVEGMPSNSVVAVQAVNHETGVIQPLAVVADLAHRAGCYLHVDAVQAFGKLETEQFLHGDSFAIAAHKIRGPKGIGALIWRCGRSAPQPLLFGGSQQRGLRPGTPDPVSVIGFARAVELAASQVAARADIGKLRDRLELELGDVTRPNIEGAARLSHVASLYVPGWAGDELVAALDVEGLCVSSGSACSAGTAEPSPVIAAMHGADRARGTLRFSLGELTTDAEVTRACEITRRVVMRGLGRVGNRV
ncbi:MAG TPA: cysteine desulfurase family protein [Polyangiaceae bacterium]